MSSQFRFNHGEVIIKPARLMEQSTKPKLVFIIGIWALICIAYSSSLNASWHLDDYQIIVRNDKLHLSHLDFDSLAGTFFAGISDKLYRPVSMLSFALNWYIHGADLLGYHIVNIATHCMNALLLYLVALSLLRTPRLAGIHEDTDTHWIALIAALLWALNPVQTQAVTYIVQRMASLAALFYLTGVYLFLRYKRAASNRSRFAWGLAIGASYLLAILSKENAVLFPIGIFLIQATFFPAAESQPTDLRRTRVSLMLALFIAGVAIVVFVLEYGSPLSFIDTLYANRPFTASQRLLTEPRVLLFYLSLLVFPAPWRLSLSHDVGVSTSLFHPWTTLPAMVALLVMVGLGLYYLRKKPLGSFACLFFFLNHVVESTILPLELIFEHRNYLPSLFLFLPLASVGVQIKRHLSLSINHGRHMIIGGSCLLIGVFINWTFARNLIWHSEKSLWEYEMLKNPGLARPYHNLAWSFYQARGDYDEALALYQKALTLKSQSTFEFASTLNNVGRILYLKHDYERALDYFERSINAHPQRTLAEYQIVMSLIQLDRWQEALERVNSALRTNETDPFHLKIKGIVLSRLGDNSGAIDFLMRSLEQYPQAEDTRLHLSIMLSRNGRFDEAVGLLAGGSRTSAVMPIELMALAEIEKLKGNRHDSDAHINRLVQHQGIEKYREMLLSWQNDNLALDIDYQYYLTRADPREFP